MALLIFKLINNDKVDKVVRIIPAKVLYSQTIKMHLETQYRG